jgi:hypothetical protein
MSMMDKIKGMMKGHGDKASSGVEKAGDFVDEKTKGKYSEHIDKGQKKLKEQLGDDTSERRGRQDDRRDDEPPGPGRTG